MLNPTMSGVDEKYDTTTSMVYNDMIKSGMTFADIVCGNQSPKSVVRVSPIIPVQKKDVLHKKQVACFTRVCWKLYLDSCVTYHTEFLIWLLKNVEDADTTLLGNCNDEVTSSSLKGYYGKFHMWVNKNVMVTLLSIPCLKEYGYHIECARDKEWVVTTP